VARVNNGVIDVKPDLKLEQRLVTLTGRSNKDIVFNNTYDISRRINIYFHCFPPIALLEVFQNDLGLAASVNACICSFVNKNVVEFYSSYLNYEAYFWFEINLEI